MSGPTTCFGTPSIFKQLPLNSLSSKKEHLCLLVQSTIWVGFSWANPQHAWLPFGLPFKQPPRAWSCLELLPVPLPARRVGYV